MAESFPERVHAWQEEAKRKLWKYWWGPIMLFLIGLAEHRIYEACNHFIDTQSNLVDLKVVLSILAFPASLRPIALGLCLFLVGLFALAAHAYWDTRLKKRVDPDKPIFFSGSPR